VFFFVIFVSFVVIKDIEMTKMLKIENLHTYFHVDGEDLKAVRGVSFTVGRGETLGLVGESGCGKTVTALSLMKLVPPPGRVERGEVFLLNREGDARNLLSFTDKEMRAVRGKEMAMIFQEPMTSLNPVFTVGDQIMEAILVHERIGKRAARGRAIELLKAVNIPDPESRIKDYPHQLSGGQRQRVMIAMALSCRPGILIADEPTTALDVTVQARILQLIARLRDENDMAVLLVTHDLGVVAQETDRVAVMYLGRLMETGDRETLFTRPAHPYTRALIDSVPVADPARRGGFSALAGDIPSPVSPPSGCVFRTRCPRAVDECAAVKPVLRELGPRHFVACIMA